MMETNENTVNFGTTAEVPPTQTDFNQVEKIDSIDSKMPLNEEVGVTKVVDGEVIENNDDADGGVMSNQHVNNKEEINCDEPAEVPAAEPSEVVQSPVKPQVLNSEPQQDEAESVNEVSDSIPIENNTVTEHDEPPPPVEDQPMEQEINDTQSQQDDAEQPDSTPPVDGVVSNDVHHSEDETKVEDVSEEIQEGKVEESTTEPVIEEPQDMDQDEDVDMKDQVDGHAESNQVKPDADEDAQTKSHVEISDVTEKEEQLVEEKKSDEELLIEHISSAYQCLDDYMKTQDQIKIKDCMSLLTEIKTLTVKTVDSLKVFTAAQKDVEKGHSSKKGKRSKSSSTKSNKGSTKHDKNDIGGESDSDPLEQVNLKEIKGLAVFAKWPNSGWFYPGVVRDLALSDWKTSNHNLTVTFYDGLERDMKSINIFPAELIPASSILFDLDEETDLTVTAVEREDNWVKYGLSASGQSENVTKDFDKLAIKGAHMKTIKQAVDTSTDAASKTETLVTGRRARGKSSVFNEDYVSSSSPRSSEKRKTKVDDSKSNSAARAPAKRKSSTKEDDESGDSTPSRSASKRRQVNGTKSTPRRAAKK